MKDARTHRGRGAILAALAALTCGALAGCPPPPQPTAAADPATQPATAPAASRPAAPTPIPPQALLHLEELKPAIEKPVNPAGAGEIADRAKPLVGEATRLLEAKDYAGAIASLERAIGYDPKNPKVLRLLGLAYVGLGDRGRAEDHLQKAVDLAPDDFEAQALLGNLLLLAQKPAAATLACRKALLCTGADPNDPLAAEVLLKLGDLLAQQNSWTAAAECYAKLAQWLDRPPARYAQRADLQQLMLRPEQLMVKRGTLLLLLHRAREAEELLRSAHNLNRTDTTYTSLLLRCLLELKNFSGAESVLTHWIGDLGEREASRFVPPAAEEVARAAGDANLPGRIWRAVSRKTQADPALAVGLAQVCQRLGANDAAVEILQSVFQSMPQNVTMARELAELAAGLGRPEQGLAILVKTLAVGESALPAVDQGLRRLAHSLPEGFEEQQAQKPPPDPNDAFAYHFAVGRLASLRAKGPLASAEYQKSVEARKSFRPAREALLDTLLDQRRFDEARQQLEGMKDLVEPWFTEYLRGKVELAQNNLAEAAKALDKSLGTEPQNAPTLLLLAEIDVRKGQPLEALRRFDAALQLPGGDKMEIYRRRFPLLLEQERFRQAETEIETLRGNDPGNVELGVMAAQLYLRINQRSKAAALIADLAKKFPQNSDVIVLGLQADLDPATGLFSKSDLERCRARLEETLRRDPRNLLARRFLAEAYLLAARYPQAVAAAKKLHEDLPGDLEAAHLAVRAALRARQYPLAKEVLEETLRLAPGDGPARQTILEVLERLKDYDRAAELARQWLAQAEDDSQKVLLRLELLQVYDQAKTFDKAAAILEEWARTADRRVLAMVKESQIRLLARMGKAEDALKIVSELAGGSEGAIKPRLTLIQGLNEDKKYDRSIQLLDEWIGTRKDANAEYLTLRLLTYSEANRPDKVRAAAARWIQDDPLYVFSNDERSNPTPRAVLLDAIQKAQKYDEALKLLGEWQAKLSSASGPSSAPAPSAEDQERAQWLLEWCRGETTRFLFISKKYDEALQLADRAIAQDANNVEMLNLKSNCLAQLGKKKESLEALEAAWKLKPFNGLMLNNLGYNYADQGVELPRAEQMIRRSLAAALANKERTLYVLDSLGWVLYKKGSLREAGLVFEDSLRDEEDKRSLAKLTGGEDEEDQAPISSLIYDHAGDVFWRLGWSDRAIEYWKAALESAGKEKRDDIEAVDVRAKTPLKIQAAQSGGAPAVAPLGEGVKEETK